MATRLAILDDPTDTADIVQAWNDSQPVISARWPASEGGPRAIPPWTANSARLFMASQPFWIVDLSATGGPRCAGFLSARLSDGRLGNILTAVTFVRAGTPAQQLAGTILRFRRVLFDGLTAMCLSVPASTPIDARYPHLTGDTTAVGSVLTFLGQMTERTGVNHVVKGSFREWPNLTAGTVLAGLNGLVP